MSDEKLYLKQNALIEPLFNQWYAWSLVMAPATAAMTVANHHVNIMQSFISMPEMHMEAVKNPAMLGGPFMNHDKAQVPEVQALLDRTLSDAGHLIKFSDAVKALDEVLLEEAAGFSLESIYPRVPEPLQGYVELVYDLHNRASARFIEGMLYESPYYHKKGQSVAFSLVSGDDRPFVLSTPRLEDESQFMLNIPWDHPGLDAMIKMKEAPETFAFIKDALGFADSQDEKFRTLLTTEPPRKGDKYTGDGIRVRYLGHACVLIESKDVTILTDPYLSYDYPNDLPRYTLADLPDTIDYIVITHAHSDHTSLETLLQLRSKTKNILVPKNGGGALQDPSLKFLLQYAGFNQVREVDEMERIPVPGGEIIGLPFFGEHGDLNIRTKLAWYAKLNGRSVVCAADSNNLEPKLYKYLHDMVGDVNVVFIGMECEGAPMSWLYGPLLTRPLARRMDQTRRLDGSNFEKAIDIVDTLNPEQVYVYAMGQEPWLNHVMAIAYDPTSPQMVESDKMVVECTRRGLPTERLFCRKEIFA